MSVDRRGSLAVANTNTGIQWTETTWSPTTGCDQVSAGCDNCYALSMAARLKRMGVDAYQEDGDPRTSGPGFAIQEHPDRLEQPLHWRKPRRVFVDSMSDLFHPGVSDEFIARVFSVMARAPQHTFQILTKRPRRMRALLNKQAWRDLALIYVSQDETLWEAGFNFPLDNVWLGVSVEDQQRADERIPPLLDTPSAVRFLSCEPLLDRVDLTMVDWNGSTAITPLEHDPNGIDWVIIGGESGPDARLMELPWARRIVDQCRSAGVAVFVKQLGTIWAEGAGHGRTHGGEPEHWPGDLRVRQFPDARQTTKGWS